MYFWRGATHDQSVGDDQDPRDCFVRLAETALIEESSPIGRFFAESTSRE